MILTSNHIIRSEITCNVGAGQGINLEVIVNISGIWNLPGLTFSYQGIQNNQWYCLVY